MTHHRSDEERIEEMAEEIWSMTERGQNDRERIIGGSKLGRDSAEQVLAEMGRRFMAEEREGNVVLTPPGEVVARAVIRRHRLAEVLLTQVLSVGEADTEFTACQVEHILSAEVTDRICTFLGHPPSCPHGKEIPRGDCCASFQRQMEPLVQPLSELSIGGSARVVFIAPTLSQRLDRLLTLGIRPGGVIRLKQSRPSIVLEAGETSVALDREICREIFVLPLND